MTNELLSSGDLQFLKKLSHGMTLSELFEKKGIIRSGILITRIIRLAKRGYVTFGEGRFACSSPRCVPTIAGEGEVIRSEFEEDPFWKNR
jgi:hypothetical protein